MRNQPVVLFDAMDTIVKDPFYAVYPQFFGMPLKELLPLKNPEAWPEFERGHLGESGYVQKAFVDGRSYNYGALKEAIYQGYHFLEGMEELLKELNTQGVEMHIMSNYPVWYRMLDEKLQLSRYLPWTFVSYETGLRKPDKEAYLHAIRRLERRPEEIILVDDRNENCKGAQAAGLRSILFEDEKALRASLAALGFSFEATI